MLLVIDRIPNFNLKSAIKNTTQSLGKSSIQEYFIKKSIFDKIQHMNEKGNLKITVIFNIFSSNYLVLFKVIPLKYNKLMPVIFCNSRNFSLKGPLVSSLTSDSIFLLFPQSQQNALISSMSSVFGIGHSYRWPSPVRHDYDFFFQKLTHKPGCMRR